VNEGVDMYMEGRVIEWIVSVWRDGGWVGEWMGR
jgi:hypothetical protein